MPRVKPSTSTGSSTPARVASFVSKTRAGAVARRLLLSAALVPPVVNYLQLVGQRRRLLDYLKRTNFQRYKSVIERLGIRK